MVDVHAGRLAYDVISILCMLLVGVLFGIRIRYLLPLKVHNPIRLLMVALCINAMALIFTEHTFSSGVGFLDATTCLVGSVLDMIFFFAGKITLHFFLLERVRVVRKSTHEKRLRDWTWMLPAIILASGFAALGVVGFRFLNHEEKDGVCSLGFPPVVSALLLAYDVIVSILLTMLFVYLLHDTMKVRRGGFGGPVRADGPVRAGSPSSMVAMLKPTWKVFTKQVNDEESAVPPAEVFVQPRRPSDERMRNLIKKTLIGACLAYIPFTLNLALLVAYHGLEQDWFCFIICTLDTTWCVCVTFWLTQNPEEDKK